MDLPRALRGIPPWPGLKELLATGALGATVQRSEVGAAAAEQKLHVLGGRLRLDERRLHIQVVEILYIYILYIYTYVIILYIPMDPNTV